VIDPERDGRPRLAWRKESIARGSMRTATCGPATGEATPTATASCRSPPGVSTGLGDWIDLDRDGDADIQVLQIAGGLAPKASRRPD
jgi:hypothetical protein